jgi:hypothetical protein
VYHQAARGLRENDLYNPSDAGQISRGKEVEPHLFSIQRGTGNY